MTNILALSYVLQASIAASTDRALADSDSRQAAAQVVADQDATEARKFAEATAAAARTENASRVSAIAAESEELLKRLGLQRR